MAECRWNVDLESYIHNALAAVLATNNLRKATSVATPATGIYYKLSLIHYGQETLNFENVEPVKRPQLLCPYSMKGVITT